MTEDLGARNPSSASLFTNVMSGVLRNITVILTPRAALATFIA